MIGYYYTGASGYSQPQNNPSKSLGGYISSSQIPNALEGNLFPGTSLRNLERGSLDVGCIALKNLGEEPITSLIISLDVSSIVTSEISLGLVVPNLDSCGKPNFELLPSANSLPTFTELEILLSDESFNLDLSTSPWEPNTYLGLWISRKVNKNSTLSNRLECEECNKLYSNFQENKFDDDEKEVIKLVFDFS